MTDNDNIELKKRSRRRLVGAAALALLAAIILPMVMDDEPGIPVQDIQVTIPDRAADSRPIGAGTLTVDPASVPVPQEQPESVVEHQTAVVVEPPEPAARPPQADEAPKPPAVTAEPSKPPVAALPQTPKPPPVAEEAERVRAILEGKLAAAGSDTAFVVQVGAFGDAAKATAMRDELDGQGFEAFTETAGAVTRVRLGPYASRGEAEKVAERLRKMGIGGVVQSR